MEDSRVEKKAETIKSLVNDCKAAQGEIRSHLIKHFARHPQTEGVEGTRPEQANILDEIADDLRELNKSQADSIAFIAIEINAKIIK